MFCFLMHRMYKCMKRVALSLNSYSSFPPPPPPEILLSWLLWFPPLSPSLTSDNFSFPASHALMLSCSHAVDAMQTVSCGSSSDQCPGEDAVGRFSEFTRVRVAGLNHTTGDFFLRRYRPINRGVLGGRTMQMLGCSSTTILVYLWRREERCILLSRWEYWDTLLFLFV